MTPLLKESFRQWTEERVNARLRKAIENEESKDKEAQPEIPTEENNEPTANELDIMGLNIVKAILSEVCDVGRLNLRPSKSYCALLLDDNNRKTIVRFYFKNPDRLKLDLYGFLRVEPPFAIESVENLYDYKDQIIEIFQKIEVGDTGLGQKDE